LEEGKTEISGHIEIHGKGYLEFRGDADQVIDSILRFLSEIYPAFEIVSNLTISIDLEELMRELQGLIGISDEGLVVLKSDLPADVSIMLCLIGSHISSKIGRVAEETMGTKRIAKLVGKATKTIRNEIPDLMRKGWIERVGRGEYRATTMGIVQFQKQILPSLKENG